MKQCHIFWMVMVSIWAAAATSYAAKILDFPVDGRIKMLEYHANDIYTVHTLYGYQTNVEFESEEQVQTISVGDRSMWQIIPAGNRLFIRPMDEDVATNMTVITNVRAYQFDLKAGKGTPKENPGLVYVVRFMYPSLVPVAPAPPSPPPMASTIETPRVLPPVLPPVLPSVAAPVSTPAAVSAPAVSAPAVSAAPVAVPASLPTSSAVGTAEVPVARAAPIVRGDDRYNTLYSYSGKDALAPTDTYDDGAATYLRFPKAAKLPEIYALAPDGARVRVDHVVRDSVVVLPQVGARYALVYGPGKEETVYLYNESKTPAAGAP